MGKHGLPERPQPPITNIAKQVRITIEDMASRVDIEAMTAEIHRRYGADFNDIGQIPHPEFMALVDRYTI